MEHLVVAEVDVLVFLAGFLIGVSVVDIINLPFLITIGLDVFRQKRIQRHDVVSAVPDDLRVAVSPQEQMRHHRLPERKARHFRIGLPVQQLIQRMIHSAFLRIGAVLHPVQMQRKSCHRLGQKPDAGIDRRDLHGRFLIHPLAGIGPSEYKGLPRVADVIRHLRERRSIPWADAQPFKESHVNPSRH